MHGRKLDVRWTLVLPVLALAVLAIVFFNRGTGEAPGRASTAAQPARISQTLGSREYRAATAPTLAQSLQAADLLVKAGELAPPPTLAESLVAADLLVKAGKLAPPPTLAESLRAADLLVKAGALAPPQPSLGDSILAAAALVKASKLAPPPQSLADAQEQAAASPPASTPVPSKATPFPVTNTPALPPIVAVAGAATGLGGYYDDAFAAQVFARVNERRQAAGVPLLAVEPRLANSAATYAKVLADNRWFSHTGPDGSTLVTRDEAAGFPFTVQIGEVLAWGSNGWTPAEIVQAWIDSPAHKEQILSPIYTRAGAGCYFTNEDTLMVRCAMEFAAAE